MKSLVATLGCLLALGGVAVGQAVSVQLALDQQQYLPGESLPVKVRITNESGQDLALGKDPNWLDFRVEEGEHSMMSPQGTIPVQKEFTIESSMTGTRTVDIAPYFDLTRTGRYYVSAVVRIPQWNQVLRTKPLAFDVIKGSSLWDKDFGVPPKGQGADAVPEFRRYSLVETRLVALGQRIGNPSADPLARVIKVYVRLTDTQERRVFAIYPLGTMVSFSDVQPQLDRFSNLHVLFQSGARSFLHCLINPDGVLLARETYDCSESRPAFHPEADGRITIRGGFRVYGPEDLPPPFRPNDKSNATTSVP